MPTERMTEISFEVTASECAVLDGYCQAKGIKRTQQFRRILQEWSENKHREAMMICRVAGVKPGEPGMNRWQSE